MATLQPSIDTIEAVDEIALYDDIERASKLTARLKKESGFTGSMQQFIESFDEPIVKDRLLKLALVRFSSLQNDDCIWIIKNHFMQALSFSEIDVAEKIGKKIGTIEWEEDKYSFMADIVKALKENNERLTHGTIRIEGKDVPGTVKSWLEDYQNSPSASAYKGNMEELTYINTSPNAKQITPQERQALLTVFKIFDTLNSRAGKYYNAPEVDAEAVAFKDFDLYRTLPGLVFSENRVQPAGVVRPQSVRNAADLSRVRQPSNISKSPAGAVRKPSHASIDIDRKLKDLSKRAKQ